MEDRKSTRLNSSHTVIYTLSLQRRSSDLEISSANIRLSNWLRWPNPASFSTPISATARPVRNGRSEEHTSELQSHRDLHSFPTTTLFRSGNILGQYPAEQLASLAKSGFFLDTDLCYSEARPEW